MNLKSKYGLKENKYVLKDCIFLFILFFSIFIPEPIYQGFFILRVFDIVLLFFLFRFLLRTAMGEKVTIIRSNIYWFYMFFITWAFFSVLWGTEFLIVIKNGIQYIELLLFMVIIISDFKNLELKRINNIFYTAVMIATLLYILMNFIQGNYFDLKVSSNKVLPGLMTVLTFNYFLFRKDKRVIILLFLIVFLTITLLTFERKSWVALLFSIPLQLILYNKYIIRKTAVFKFNKLKFLIVIIFIAIIIISSFLFNYNLLIKKQILSTIALFQNNPSIITASNISRKDLLEKSAIIFYKSPILGIGLENFKSKYIKVTSLSKARGAHNEIITVLVELGFVGLLFFLPLLFYPLKIFLKFKKYRDKLDKIQIRNGIFILGLWSYGFGIIVFRASGLINYIFTILPIILYIKFEAEIDY